jgi:hypothetical protein
MTHDEPLTVADLARAQHGVAALAERLAPHLGPEWRARIEHQTLTIALHTEDGLRLALRYDDTGGMHQVAVTAIAPNGGTLRRFTMNLFLLPSQMGARIRSEMLPEYRRRMTKEREAEARKNAEVDARRGHAEAIAARLGSDWRAAEGSYGPRVERPRKQTRIFGEISFSDSGRLHLDLHNLTPELIEHIVDGIAEQMKLHENGSVARGKRPKRLSQLLHLMVAAGYRIDVLADEHKKLFGDHLFKMDMRTSPGMPLVPFLFERQWALDTALRALEKG